MSSSPVLPSSTRSVSGTEGLNAVLNVEAADLISVRQLPHHRHHHHHHLLSSSSHLSISALTLYGIQINAPPPPTDRYMLYYTVLFIFVQFLNDYDDDDDNDEIYRQM